MGFCLALAVRDMHMTAEEALLAATLGGALALRRTDVGHLAPGARADAAILAGALLLAPRLPPRRPAGRRDHRGRAGRVDRPRRWHHQAHDLDHPARRRQRARGVARERRRPRRHRRPHDQHEVDAGALPGGADRAAAVVSALRRGRAAAGRAAHDAVLPRDLGPERLPDLLDVLPPRPDRRRRGPRRAAGSTSSTS